MNTNDITEMDPLLKLINTGAHADFQWLFMAMLVLVLTTAAYLARRQMSQIDTLVQQARQDSMAHAEVLETHTEASIERSERFAEVVTKNSSAFENVTKALDRISLH